MRSVTLDVTALNISVVRVRLQNDIVFLVGLCGHFNLASWSLALVTPEKTLPSRSALCVGSGRLLRQPLFRLNGATCFQASPIDWGAGL